LLASLFIEAESEKKSPVKFHWVIRDEYAEMLLKVFTREQGVEVSDTTKL